METIIQQARELKSKYAFFEKQKYGREWSRQDQVQGLVVDIGELVELTMAADGIRPKQADHEQRLAHELADCWWSIMVIADQYQVDLNQSFQDLVQQLSEKLDQTA